MQWMKGGKQAPAKGGPAGTDPAAYSFPKFAKGSLVDMYCFLSEKPHIRYYDEHMSDLIWSETGLEVATSEPRNYSLVYEPSQAVQRNGSVYLHVLFAQAGVPLTHQHPDFNEDLIFGSVHNLIAYYPRPKNATGVNLLSGDALPKKPDSEEIEVQREYVGFLKPNITIQLVDHFQAYPQKNIPQPLAVHMAFDNAGNHFPIIHFNEFWLLRDKMVLMNETVTNVTLYLEVGHVAMWWWQIMTQMEKSFDMQRSMGMQSDGESDEFKRILLEGNPILLGVTMFVSLLHTVFDMLAFKNDIGFWKNNKSMEGLSARSVLINAGCQLVILLYLFDNETSMVVLFSSVVGTAIEFWKVTKAMQVTWDPTRFPFLKFQDRQSYSTNKTKQYDEEATRYLSYVLYPLVIGYAIYSLAYKTHKSWYSWILNSLVGAVYMFGFILMCPQLYLNYKLKSVAHLPWRQMTYKFLNTIIDDLFAFVIKMPILHRLSVFRDDVIFLIFLYQRWIYRVDKSRVNEFGWAPEEDAVADAAPEALEGPKAEEDVKQIESDSAADTADAAGTSTRRRKGDKKAGTAAKEEPTTAETAKKGGDKKDK